MKHCFQNCNECLPPGFRGKKVIAYGVVFRMLILISLFILNSLPSLAQDSISTKQEVWPEVNLFYKLNNKFRLYGQYSATKLKNSSYTDGGWAAYLDYFGLPIVKKRLSKNVRDSTNGYYLWLRAGYMYSTTPADSKDPYKLHTLVTEANFRFYLPYDILVTNKNRFDWRLKNGDFEPRFRPRLTFEKEMHTAYMFFTPNIYGEYYYYFGEKGFNRFRLSAGVQVKVTRHIEFETYYVHEFDNGERVNALNAMGFRLKFYLKHKEVMERFSKKKE